MRTVFMGRYGQRELCVVLTDAVGCEEWSDPKVARRFVNALARISGRVDYRVEFEGDAPAHVVRLTDGMRFKWRADKVFGLTLETMPREVAKLVKGVTWADLKR